MRRRSFVIASVLLAISAALCRAQNTHQEEADRLAVLLNWQADSTVADAGAGEGQMTVAAAKRVGRVYTTELDAKMLAHLQELAAKEKNIIALKAAEAETNLPPECCDSIFMRFVYHHLTKPADIDAYVKKARIGATSLHYWAYVTASGKTLQEKPTDIAHWDVTPVLDLDSPGDVSAKKVKLADLTKTYGKQGEDVLKKLRQLSREQLAAADRSKINHLIFRD
jgi:SAM-dependent methyltransferase